MSLSRRTLLSAFGALAGTASTGVAPSKIAAALAAGSVSLSGDVAEIGPNAPIPGRSDDWWSLIRPHLEHLHVESQILRGEYRLPAKIASKRSWSDSYKESIGTAEYRRLLTLINELRDESTGKRLLKTLLAEDSK